MDDQTSDYHEPELNDGFINHRARQRVWICEEEKLLIRMVHRGYREFYQRRGMKPPAVSGTVLEFGWW